MHKFAVRVLQQNTVYEGRRGFMIKKGDFSLFICGY